MKVHYIVENPNDLPPIIVIDDDHRINDEEKEI